MNLRILTSLGVLVAVPFASCAHDPQVNAAQTRGAVGGAAIGAVVGQHAGGIGKGEAIAAGAVIGALVSENRLRTNNPDMAGRR